MSKLLLCHGIVYSGGQAWSNAHDAWLRRQRFDSPLVQVAFDEAYDSVITITARRDRLVGGGSAPHTASASADSRALITVCKRSRIKSGDASS